VADSVVLAIATLDSATATAYAALRDLGLSTEAAKDAITVHVSDTLVACQAQRDELPADEDDDTGGVRTR
jgi:hypothetical protein